MSDFDHILTWKLLRGSHAFPGPDGGTCINEAAIVACGFPYQRVGSVRSMPDCFSRPICQLAMRLNDEATDAQRLRLMPFVTRLACSDVPEVEQARARYVDACLNNVDPFFPTMPFQFNFDDGLVVLEGVLRIGRQADPLGFEDAAARLDATRDAAVLAKKKSGFWSAKVKAWLSLQKATENA